MTVQKILLHYDSQPENLLPAIKEINKIFGFVSMGSVNELASYFSMDPSAVYETASFYDQIEVKETVPVRIKICDGANCSMKLSESLIEEVEKFFRVKAGDQNNRKVEIRRTSCLGLCTQGPVMVVNDTVFEKVKPERVHEILGGYV